MEEAYNELYQQFLRLRSLCLKQAALLHQLTTALQKQQGLHMKQTTALFTQLISHDALNTQTAIFCAGASVSNGEFSHVMSVPVQFTHEIPAYLLEKPQILTSETQIPAGRCGIDCHSRNVNSFPDLLTDDMSKLCVDMPSQRKEAVQAENKFPLLLPLDSSRFYGESSNESKNSKQRDPGGDRTLHAIRV